MHRLPQGRQGHPLTPRLDRTAVTPRGGGRPDVAAVAAWLARRDVPALDRSALGAPAEALVLCGSAVLRSVEVAARAWHEGVVGSLLVTGGVGHSTRYLAEAVRRRPDLADVPVDGRPEAEVLADLLRRLDVPDDAVVLETASTNCGENAASSVALLREAGRLGGTVVLVQDPTMQRRTHASVERALGGDGTRVVSFAPVLPVVGEHGVGDAADPDGDPVWSLERFTSLVLGEVRRLRDDEHGYGPRGAGFIDHVDVPGDVAAAADRLAAASPHLVREAWGGA